MEEKKENKVLMVKSCEVMQYIEYIDTNSIQDIERRIKELVNIKKYAIILHDKDVLEDTKEQKKPHFHAVMTFSNAKTVKTIADAIHVEQQYVNKIKTTTKSAMLYLVHRNNPEKYQYATTDVLSNFDYINYVDDCEPKQHRDIIAQRIASGEIKAYNLCKFVTCDEFAKNKRYYDNCIEYRQNQLKLKGNERKMECIFITGSSGTGKSTYAKTIASQKGYACYISSGGKNPLDNYKGEECIILDDTRSSTWNLTDFLKLTDNHTDSLVGCRYYNKSIAECKMLIVTSVKSISEFYENATKEDNEPRIQLYRRFKMLIEMQKETMQLSSYDETTQSYVIQFRAKNPVALMFNPVIAKKFVDDFATFMGLEKIEDTKHFQKSIEDEDVPF